MRSAKDITEIIENMARPTKLSKEVIERIDSYLKNIEKESIVIKRGLDEEGNTRWEQTGPKLPNHARLAVMLGVNKDTLYAWQRPRTDDTPEATALRKEFSDRLLRVKALQEAILNEQGVAGVFSAAVTNRILSSNHGYKDRNDITSDDESISPRGRPLSPEEEKAVHEFNEAMRKVLTQQYGTDDSS